MSAEALLAVLTSAGLLCMFFGVKGMLAPLVACGDP